jgi:AraC-like DNA-binding protein
MNRLRFSNGVTFGEVTYPPGGAFGPRTQADVQLFVVLEGKATVTINGSRVDVHAGQALVLHPGATEHFAFSTARSTRHTWCAVEPALIPTDLRSSLTAARDPITLTPRVADLVQYGLNLPESGLDEAAALLRDLGIATLRAFLFDLEHARLEGREPDAVGRARWFVDAHLDEALALEDLARVAGVSAQHLTRLFKQHLGFTPMRYLWAERVKRGVQLLLDTGLSVSAISERVGFESPFHFSRLVRDTHGASPRALRERHWRKPG